MKKIRLLLLTLMLAGSFAMLDSPASACAGEGNCPQADRPNGCKCCSDNHCASGRCNINTEKCEAKPGDEGPLPEEPPQN